MMANWTKVWCVAPGGTRLDEFEASRGRHVILVRKRGAESAASESSYSPPMFDLIFGKTPQEAIDRFLLREHLAKDQAQRQIRKAEAAIAAAEKLRTAVRAVPRGTSRVKRRSPHED